MDVPIACTLTEAELRERRRTVLDSIRESAIDATPTADGYSYAFKPTSEVLETIITSCRFGTAMLPISHIQNSG